MQVLLAQLCCYLIIGEISRGTSYRYYWILLPDKFNNKITYILQMNFTDYQSFYYFIWRNCKIIEKKSVIYNF